MRTATSAMASAYSHGLTMAALGAYSAPATSGERPGSMARVSSADSSRMPGTPLARPFSYSFCRCGSSAGLRASTRLPHCRYGTSSRAQISLASATPSTLSRAIRVPGSGSYPACRMALLAFVVQSATSFSASKIAVCSG